MPLYEGECDCGWHGEDIIPLATYSEVGITCPNCGCRARTIIYPVPTIGPMPSKPIVSQQLNREFTSVSELREYERQNPGSKIISADSEYWRQHVDTVQEKSEQKAKVLGFRDADERKEHLRKEQKTRQKFN